MSASIQIAYATRSGSTAEVAESIAATLREVGLWADLAAVGKVESLQGTTALILGAPLYMGKFPRDFHWFLGHHRSALTHLHPFCFVLGPTRPESADFEEARKQAEQEFAHYQWLHLAGLQVFGGRWDVNLLPFPFSLARRLPFNPLAKVPGEDIRDWSAIHDWSLTIAAQIKPAA
ncbi:MAG: flavodoxin domain-containing protein [Rhodoferax sp.]|nr:flavodoxin domain-containing protein [Rhodoferax sp.]